VRSWKEHARRGLAAVAAELIVAQLATWKGDALTFVPAVADRERWRGHNTAEHLGRELARRWGLPLVAALGRQGNPAPQRGQSLAARRANVAGGFRAVTRVPSRLALVDDVYTTGATVAAAATALRAAGARRIDVFTFARALRGAGSALR
jgi:predicted amidophosphoribosyltransferase